MKRYGFGIDVGGTAIKMGLFTTDGELIENGRSRLTKKIREAEYLMTLQIR